MKGEDLASEWGRNSSFQSGRKSGKAGLNLFVVILALTFGAAVGYFGSRFNQPEVDALQDKIAQQAGELDAMAQSLAASTNEVQPPVENTEALDALSRERDRLAAENTLLTEKVAKLEAEINSPGLDADTDSERDAAELARLETEVIPKLTEERDQLRRKNMMMLTEQTTLEAQARAATEAKAADKKRIADLEAQLAAVERQLTASEEALSALKTKQTEAPAVAVPAISQKPVDLDQPTLDPRNGESVAEALRSTPGLGLLSDIEREKLTGKLVAGECVTSALESVFERVPILALRNLIRELDSVC